jgi:hypothetical protein
MSVNIPMVKFSQYIPRELQRVLQRDSKKVNRMVTWYLYRKNDQQNYFVSNPLIIFNL